MTEKLFRPNYFEFRNIPFWNNMFGVKIHFDCGNCGYSQDVRVPLRDNPTVECKHCGELNKIPVVTTYGL